MQPLLLGFADELMKTAVSFDWYAGHIQRGAEASELPRMVKARKNLTRIGSPKAMAASSVLDRAMTDRILGEAQARKLPPPPMPHRPAPTIEPPTASPHLPAEPHLPGSNPARGSHLPKLVLPASALAALGLMALQHHRHKKRDQAAAEQPDQETAP